MLFPSCKSCSKKKFRMRNGKITIYEKGQKSRKNVKHGEFQFQIKNQIAAMKWKGNKAVNVLSSVQCPRQKTEMERELRLSESCRTGVQPVYWVELIKFDQLHERYAVDRKSLKRWHRIFYFLVDLAIVKLRFIKAAATTQNVINWPVEISQSVDWWGWLLQTKKETCT